MKQKILSFLIAILVAMMVPIGTRAEAIELPVDAGASGYTTFYAPFAASLPNAVKAYAVEGVEADVLTLVEKADVSAGEGVILKGEGSFSLTYASETTSDWTGNMLEGSLMNTNVDVEEGYAYYQFNEDDAIWYKVTDFPFTNSAYKVYLKLPEQLVEGKDMLFINEKDVPQNSCGDNLTWNLTDGELVIEGTGAMYDFEAGTAPWYSHKDEIVKLTIKSGVTSVGHYAFNECSKIADVVIPNGVTSLGTHAFGYCDGLTVVSLPPSVRTIGWSAFYTCRNLKTVNLSEGVTRIGEYSFADCRNLSVLNIPEGVTEIGQWAFRNCSFTSLILPSTLTAIQSYAFFDCNKLTSLTCLATTSPGLWLEAFATLSLSVPIYVPSASVADYQSQEQWNTFTIQAVCSGDSDHSFTNGICEKCGAYEPAVDSNSDGYYEIGNAGQLFWFANYVNLGNYSAHAVLTADIDLENRKWTPIAYFNEAVEPYIDNHYKGVFDGNNHVIKNLNVHVTDGREAGLFSRFNFGTLKNLGVINVRVQSDPFNEKSIRAGVLAGEIHDATVTNVFSRGNISIITDHHQKGGIAGECNYSYMNNCYTTYGTLTDTNVRGCSNCFYLADEVNANSAGTAVTAAQMASGEMAYKLGAAYGQTIGTDALPVLGGPQVYYGYTSCKAAEKIYTNDASVTAEKQHNYVDGVCTECGKVYEPKITITMNDSYGDGWESGAAINIKKDGVSVALATVEFGKPDGIFTMEYSPTSQYEFLWVRGGQFDNECSFVISLDDQTLFTGELNGSWLNNTETPFYTMAACEATWGASFERQTSWGTYSEAISAAEAGRAVYVKLNKDVTSVTEIHSGTFTLDVNGHVMRVNDYVLNIQGANVTITDSSDGPVGILHNDNFWHRAIMASNGATVYVEKVQVMGAGAVEVLESSNVTIASGTYSSTEHPTVENKSGTLTILGGTFQTETEATVTSIKSAIRTTIFGGVFAEGYDATIIYETGVLDLSGYANPAGISVYTYDDVPLGASTISLPTDYLFFNGEEAATEVLNSGTKYTIRNAEVFTVAFDANGGTGEMEDVSTYSDYRLPECTFIAPEGMGFKAWLVNEVEYQPNDVITITENTTITAVWATPYTLAFSANGGVGSLVALKTLNTVTLPECPFLAPEGKEFKAWRIGENEYAAGSVATLTENAVAYAVWKDAVVAMGTFTLMLEDMMAESLSRLQNLSYYTVTKDGELVATIKLSDDYAVRQTLEYDPNCEYAFYWHTGGNPHESPYVWIRLNGESLFDNFGAELENRPADEPFLFIPRKTQDSRVATLNIIDGELPEYLVLREAEVGMLTYTRTLPNQEWNALYLPFEIPVSELEENYDVAYFNDVHSYDTDNDGDIDEMEMEIIKIAEGTLKANHPYLIRAKTEDAKAMSLVLTDVIICCTTENNHSVTCSSAYMQFEVAGTYAQMKQENYPEILSISTTGEWMKMAEGTALNPFRLHLTLTTREGSPVKVEPSATRSIRIRSIDESETTGVDGININEQQSMAVYDISGRCVKNPVKGIYIVNGKKVMLK